VTQSDLGQSGARARLARELHDGIAQDLVGVGYCLDLLLANPETTVDARSQLRTLRFTITELIDKVRREIYFLRQPSTLNLADEIRVSAQTLCIGLELKIELDEETRPLDSELSYEIIRIAQEALRNIAAHALATSVTISLVQTENLLDLRISDDGVGGAEPSGTRYGIQGIRDRALAINSSIEINSDSKGTRIWLRVPLEEHASI